MDTRKEVINTKEYPGTFTVLFERIFKEINSKGLTKQEFNSLKDQPIGHKNFGEFIEANIAVGNFEWRDGRLINSQRKLSLDLGKNAWEKLRFMAMKAKVPENELVNSLLLEVLRDL